MRIITDSDGRVLDVSFGALISCGGQDGQEYTGSVPADYTSLEDWYLQEADKLYRWTVVDGELTLDSSATAPTDKLPAADYVVEQGTSGNWTYRKWNSGIAECWGTHNPSSSASGTEGGLYFQGIYIDFPSGLFASAPRTLVTAHGSWIGGAMTGNGLTAAKWQGYRWTPTSQTNTGALKIELYCIGTWK